MADKREEAIRLLIQSGQDKHHAARLVDRWIRDKRDPLVVSEFMVLGCQDDDPLSPDTFTVDRDLGKVGMTHEQ